ncbi:Hydroxyacylglutathione hydrolase [Lentibacillus sp. JNUCC-1]|nr:Hydroxyacylglutathione hydrolase [Lentibacillus sp. JNUCC-1]
MDQQYMQEGKDSKFIPMTSIMSGVEKEVTEDISYYTDQIANVIMIGAPDGNGWVLADAGLPYGAKQIKRAAAERFGEGVPPQAIILTHGHFDHVGSLVELLDEWDVPVYAHELEMPYLTGEKSYPIPDGSVEGGFWQKYPQCIRMIQLILEIRSAFCHPIIPYQNYPGGDGCTRQVTHQAMCLTFVKMTVC